MASCAKGLFMMSAPASASNREAVLSLLLRRGESEASDLADAIGISVQAMRRHLRSLADDHLVEATISASGPGRPSNRWRLTRKGEDHFPDGSGHFALGLLDSMRTILPPELISTLLQQQAIDKAVRYRQKVGQGSLETRLRRLADLRCDEGYLSECVLDSDGSWCLHEMHCSVQRIAERFPAVCDQELMLIRHTFQDCNVERVHWRLDGEHSCGFKLTPFRRA